MTAIRRFDRTARPMDRDVTGIQPMTEDDAEFWRLRNGEHCPTANFNGWAIAILTALALWGLGLAAWWLA